MLYIMRHGLTDWNVERKMQGQSDIPLNEKGRLMAIKAHDEYLNVHFDICFSSPLIRALETAELVLQNRDVPIVVDERLREMSFGCFEGQPYCFDKDEGPLSIIFRHPEDYRESIGGSETWVELFARTKSFLKEQVEPLLKQNKDVLIVAHGSLNNSIISQIKKAPIEEFWSFSIENCKLIRLV